MINGSALPYLLRRDDNSFVPCSNDYGPYCDGINDFYLIRHAATIDMTTGVFL